jgi:hypothetical protein
VLVVGGYMDNASKSIEVYNPTNQTWSTLPAPWPQGQHTATLLCDGRVLVVGGNRNTALAFLFDPVTNTSIEIKPPDEALMTHAAVRMPDGKVLVGGGKHSWLYDPDRQLWTRSGAPVILRGEYEMTLLLNGQVLMTGGDGENGTLREAELYDPATGTWALTSPMLNPRWRHTATRLPNGKVLVLGATGGNVASPTCELYTPAP